MGERWTTAQAAAWCSVEPGTYRDYVSRGIAPAALNERDPETGAKLHDADAVKSWHESRLGKGWRAGRTGTV